MWFLRTNRLRHHRSITMADEGTEGWMLFRTIAVRHYHSYEGLASETVETLQRSAPSPCGTTAASRGPAWSTEPPPRRSAQLPVRHHRSNFQAQPMVSTVEPLHTIRVRQHRRIGKGRSRNTHSPVAPHHPGAAALQSR
ncbi:hypothetical protein [Kitasatospora sp. NPDC056273]|uniref:hypothetical protein n=1 Tax=Kitasatospora sp. NPDC056273 TaxID=3345769 RepID=UPI0035E3ADD5